MSNVGPSGTVADADVRQPATNVGSRLSQSSLLRKVALNEVRRAFFTTDSSSSLVDGAGKSKTSDKDVEEAVQTSPSLEFSQPIAGRLLLILWQIVIFVYGKAKRCVRVYFADNGLYTESFILCCECSTDNLITR